MLNRLLLQGSLKKSDLCWNLVHMNFTGSCNISFMSTIWLEEVRKQLLPESVENVIQLNTHLFLPTLCEVDSAFSFGIFFDCSNKRFTACCKGYRLLLIIRFKTWRKFSNAKVLKLSKGPKFFTSHGKCVKEWVFYTKLSFEKYVGINSTNWNSHLLARSCHVLFVAFSEANIKIEQLKSKKWR